MPSHDIITDQTEVVYKGQHIKVFIPGEALWAIVIKKLGDDEVLVTLDNHPVHDKFNYADQLRFKRHKEFRSWELVT